MGSCAQRIRVLTPLQQCTAKEQLQEAQKQTWACARGSEFDSSVTQCTARNAARSIKQTWAAVPEDQSADSLQHNASLNAAKAKQTWAAVPEDQTLTPLQHSALQRNAATRRTTTMAAVSEDQESDSSVTLVSETAATSAEHGQGAVEDQSADSSVTQCTAQEPKSKRAAVPGSEC
jgi:hypothetical protein